MSSEVKEKQNSSLKLIPKYENYMEYMLKVVLIQLPRTEKYSIGNEYKSSMYAGLRTILYVDKLDSSNKLTYLNRIDAEINTQRIFLRIMYDLKWIDKKRFDYVMNTLIKEIGAMLGGLIKHYAAYNKK